MDDKVTASYVLEKKSLWYPHTSPLFTPNGLRQVEKGIVTAWKEAKGKISIPLAEERSKENAREKESLSLKGQPEVQWQTAF